MADVRSPSRQFVTYAAIGVIATGVHYACMITLVQVLGVAPVLATMAGAIAGAIVSYELNYRITFVRRAARKASAVRFIGVATLGFVVNASLFAGLLGITGWPYMACQALTTVCVFALGFGLSRHWAFRVRPVPDLVSKIDG